MSTQNNFTIVNNEIFKNDELDIYDKMIYVVLSKFAGKKSRSCYPSLDTIAKYADCSVSRVSKSVGKLEKCGFIQIIRKSGKYQKQYASSLYILNEQECQSFTTIANTILEDIELGIYEKVVYIVLNRYADYQTKSCYPSYQTISKTAGCSRRKAVDVIDILVKANLIKKINKSLDGKNSHACNLYKIISTDIPEEKQDDEENAATLPDIEKAFPRENHVMEMFSSYASPSAYDTSPDAQQIIPNAPDTNPNASEINPSASKQNKLEISNNNQYNYSQLNNNQSNNNNQLFKQGVKYASDLFLQGMRYAKKNPDYPNQDNHSNKKPWRDFDEREYTDEFLNSLFD